MRWDNIYVAGLGSYLPHQQMTADEAVAAGLYDAQESEANGIRAVRVAASDEPPAEMAAAAGRTAIARSGHDKEEFDLVLHAYVSHQGQDFWTPAAYVQAGTVGTTGAAMEVRQGSNGGLAAVELAASHLAARPNATAALVTTGDSFQLPYFDRWSSDSQQVYGDGAGAIVLSSRGGFARLRSTASIADASLEPIYRGSDAWTAAPFPNGTPVDLRTRKREYLLRNEDAYEQVIAQMGKNLSTVVQQALDDADTTLADTQFFVHANVAKTIAEWGFYLSLGVDPTTTVYDWGRDFGHMGAGDQIIGLEHLVTSGRPKAGDLVVSVGVGTGFMWTVAVMEILELPAW